MASAVLKLLIVVARSCHSFSGTKERGRVRTQLNSHTQPPKTGSLTLMGRVARLYHGEPKGAVMGQLPYEGSIQRGRDSTKDQCDDDPTPDVALLLR